MNHNLNELDCPFDFTSRCTMGRCDCKPKPIDVNKRHKNINDTLSNWGLSVIIRNKDEFNVIKKFLGEDILYLDFQDKMADKPTGVVIWSDNKDISTGSVGCIEYQKEKFIRVVKFNDFFKL